MSEESRHDIPGEAEGAGPPEEQPQAAAGGEAGQEAEAVRLAELEDHLLRTAAEFENYKKRRVREVADLLRYRSEPLVRDLLPVLDALERAIRSSEGTRDYQAFHDGVELILQQMREVLDRHAVKRDDPRGEVFDPHRHEAVAMVPSIEVAPDHVIEVVEPGYHLHDRVVRPARVVVSSGSGEQGAGEAEREENEGDNG